MPQTWRLGALEEGSPVWVLWEGPEPVRCWGPGLPSTEALGSVLTLTLVPVSWAFCQYAPARRPSPSSADRGR